MPKSLAEGREKWIILDEEPADHAAVTVEEATAGLDASCRLSSADSRISAAASTTFSDPAICDEIAVEEFGASNYEGNAAPFRYWDADGVADDGTGTDSIGDAVYQALKEKGTELWILVRETSKMSTEDIDAGDEYDLYKVTTDNPQRPTSREGYQKRIVPLSIQNAYTGVIGGAGS